MIEKKKKYTYEELKKLFNIAEKKVWDELKEQMDKTKKENNQPIDGMSSFVFQLQNMLVTSKLESILFKGEE